MIRFATTPLVLFCKNGKLIRIPSTSSSKGFCAHQALRIREVAKFQAELGGPRGGCWKMNAGEKQIYCSALEARQIVAGFNKDEKCVIAN